MKNRIFSNQREGCGYVVIRHEMKIRRTCNQEKLETVMTRMRMATIEASLGLYGIVHFFNVQLQQSSCRQKENFQALATGNVFLYDSK